MSKTIITAKRYIAIACQLVGNPADYSYSYSSDLVAHADRQAAIDHGIAEMGHDDFCIGTLAEGRLIAYGWGHDDFAPEDRDDLGEIESQIGLPL